MSENIEKIKKIISDLDIKDNQIEKKLLEFLLNFEKKGVEIENNIIFTIPTQIDRDLVHSNIFNIKNRFLYEILSDSFTNSYLDTWKLGVNPPNEGEYKNIPEQKNLSSENEQKDKIYKLKRTVDSLSKNIENIIKNQNKNKEDIKELKEFTFNIVKDNDLKNKTQFLPVNIYLDTDEPNKIFEIYKSVLNLIDVLEFEKGIELDAENGSWFKRFIAKSKKTMTSKEVSDRLKEIEYALEVKILKDQSEVDKNQSEALSNILSSLKDTLNAIIKIGSLLVIKVTIDGVSSVQVRSLTIKELHYLNKNPDLLSQPDKILNALALLHNSNDDINIKEKIN